MKLGLIGFAGICLLAMQPSLVMAASTQRDIEVRFGMTPERAAAVFRRIDGLDTQIKSLSRANGIKDATLRAIALELGARSPNLSPEQFVSLIEARAGDAAKAQVRIAELGTVIAALDPGGERSRAQTILQRARAAFDEGRLEDAEAAFGELSVLRASEASSARKAWLEALDLQAQSASLRGDTERATTIRIRKIEAIRAARETEEREGKHEEWATALAIAYDWQERGERLGDNAALIRSIGYYREIVLPLAPRERVPLDWAVTQNNLGMALGTLGERESGTARLEEAVIAFRAALLDQTRERVPLDWAGTLNGLGNTLMRLGERESGTARLEEAVFAYRAALLERTRERVPLDWAITQNNLGAVLETLGERESGTARLEEAVTAYRAALLEYTRERVPLDWAMTQSNLGSALVRLGERESGTARLEEAVIAYRAALLEQTRERVPLDWAATQSNLGNALRTLGERESGTARLEEAVAAYRAALHERTRERVSLDWAETQDGLGSALVRLGERESGTALLEEAIIAYRAALLERTRERVPLDWAMTQNNLGNALQTLGARESGIALLEEAVIAYRAALLEYTRDRMPLAWAMTQNNLGNALTTLGESESGTGHFEEAVSAYRAAQLERTRDRVPLDWAATQLGLCLTQLKIAQRSGDRAQLPALRAAVIEARQVAVDGANAQLASSANFVLDQFDQ